MCQHKNEFSDLGTDVVLISFSSDHDYTRDWIKYTCPEFTLLLNPDRQVYKTYGLRRSYLHSWNLKTIWRYIQLLRMGRKWRGIQGDSAQLGGDFIVDARGIVRLVYRSHDPTDRPKVEDLLAVLRECNIAADNY